MSGPSVPHETEPGKQEKLEAASRAKAQSDGLLPGEEFWRDHVPWLREKGYHLRARYQPDWVPSWRGKAGDYSWRNEDGNWHIARPNIMDAVRISDGEIVAFKRISRDIHPYEVDISTFLSSEPLKSDPANHCIPIFEVLNVPDEKNTSILVMPWLRAFNNPSFKTVGEAMEFFRQIFEGLQFMHRHYVAHRDCMDLNIMMDPRPMYPNMYHPVASNFDRTFKKKAKYYSRTKRPVKYYLIDFGLSRQYSASESSPREWPIWGGDKTVPEFQESDDPCDPYPTDIYYLGSMIRQHFLTKVSGLEVMLPLVGDMVQADPTKRPTIHEVVGRLSKLLGSLSQWALRGRLVYREKYPVLFGGTSHAVRSVFCILAGRAALPVPPSSPMHTFKC